VLFSEVPRTVLIKNFELAKKELQNKYFVLLTAISKQWKK